MIRRLKSAARAIAGLPRMGGPEFEPLRPGYRRPLGPRQVTALFLLLFGVCFAYGLGFGLLAPARMMPFVAPVAILLALVVWVLPSGDYAPTKALEPLFIAFFVALVMWPNYLAIAFPSLPWVTLLRLIATPLIIVLLVCISVSPPFRKQLKEILTADKWIWRMAVGVAVIQTYSMVLSRDIGFSLNHWIIAQMNMTAILVLCALLSVRKGFPQLWVNLYLVMLFILCLDGMWEARLQHVPWAGHVPSFLKVDDPSVQRALAGAARAASGIYRVQGTSTTSLGLSELLGLGVPFAMHLALERYKPWVRLTGLALIPLFIYVVILTDSRLGVVASLASVVFYLLFWALVQWRSRRTSLFGPALVLSFPAILGGVIAATFFIGRLRARVWGDGPQQASTEARKAQWALAWPKIIKNPVGYGIGEGGATLGWTNLAGIQSIDSYYISIFLELGVLGFILYYGMFLRGAYAAAEVVMDAADDREIRLLMPLGVSLINYVIVKSVLSSEANNPIAFMMLGAIVALSYRAAPLRQVAPAKAKAKAKSKAPRRLAGAFNPR
jgi:hypothetical protein